MSGLWLIVIVIVIVIVIFLIWMFGTQTSHDDQPKLADSQSSSRLNQTIVYIGQRNSPDLVRCIYIKDTDMYYIPPYAPWPKWSYDQDIVNIHLSDNDIISIPKARTVYSGGQCWPMRENVVAINKHEFGDMLRQLSV